MADNPFLEHGNSHPYLKHCDDLADEKYAAIIVHAIFQEIKMRFGEETAVKMFAPYGRTLNNKDDTIRKNAGLIWHLYYHMEKPNISELARKLAGKGKNSAARIEAWRKQIHRALNDRNARAKVESDSIELLGYSLLPDSKFFTVDDLNKLADDND
jgi:hypothetical protein